MSYAGIRVPEHIGKIFKTFKVTGEQEPLEDLHITTLFFDDLGLDDYSKAIKIITELVEKTPIFEVRTNKLSSFSKNKDNDNLIPIFCKVESDELFEFREKLAKLFEENDIDFSKKHKYNPHITLSYSDEDFEDCAFDEVSFLVTELFLVFGEKGNDRVETIFKLKQNKLSHMLLSVESFVKLAK